MPEAFPKLNTCSARLRVRGLSCIYMSSSLHVMQYSKYIKHQHKPPKQNTKSSRGDRRRHSRLSFARVSALDNIFFAHTTVRNSHCCSSSISFPAVQQLCHTLE